ncbi:hypothetical protein ABEY43_29350 [Priestia megaterium]|uniref:Alp7A family actin-like protein n=1 Tax=Priestia megaterium TaxID=1404 RepID=UPI002E1ACADD|nr:hypothetical protein [Priestia megaterium]
MKISRFNKDCGNSVDMNIMDGYLFDFPTNVVELQKDAADSFFTDAVTSPEEFKKRILLSTTIEGEEKERYFLVGDIAASQLLANNHINKLHNKITSHIPYITFLAAIAYYHALHAKDKKDNTIEIDYFSTMLPIWLLKKESTFGAAQKAMANRFLGDHSFTVHTPGFENTLKVLVEESACLKEGESARFALKKDLTLQDREDANEYVECETVMVDIGGGSIDVVILPEGLKAANSRESFQSIEGIPYLAHIDKLRKEKFLELFTDLRAFDQFILDNYSKQKFVLKNENTGESIDLTSTIKSSLREYVEILLAKLNDVAPPPANKLRKYVYCGGVAPTLEVAIMNSMREKIGEERTEKYHKVPQDSRHLNLFGLEIRSIGYVQKKQAAEKKTVKS